MPSIVASGSSPERRTPSISAPMRAREGLRPMARVLARQLIETLHASFLSNVFFAGAKITPEPLAFASTRYGQRSTKVVIARLAHRGRSTSRLVERPAQ